MSATLFYEVGHRTSWTLVHSLWQFGLIAAMLGIGLRLTRGRSPHERGGLILATLLSMTTASVVTFFAVSPPGRFAESQRVVLKAEFQTTLPAEDAFSSVTRSSVLSSIAHDDHAQDLNHRGTEDTEQELSAHNLCVLCASVVKSIIDKFMSAIVVGWLGGIILLSLRPLIGWRSTRTLRSCNRTPVSESIETVTKRVAQRLGVGRVIDIAQSTLVEVPTVIGWLKPLVLLPASAVIGLSTQQLEAVIAHELAHVRRHDYLVNLFQLVMETVFFYHPAVWWVSHRMRIEREECCDEIAVNMTGDRVGYARLLVWLEENRQRPAKQTLAMSADGGSLLGRVRRLVSAPSPSTSAGPWVTATVVALVAGAACLVSFNLNNALAQNSELAKSSNRTQIRSWMTRVIELEQWSRLPELAVRLAENGEYGEAIEWLSKAPLGPSKEGKFSPGSYSKAIGKICDVALENDQPQIALDALDKLTDPDGTPRSAEWDRRSSSQYFQAVREIRSAVLMYHVSRGQFDAALAYMESQPVGTHTNMVADVAKKLPRRGHGDQVEAFSQRLSDPKLQVICRSRLANAYYHLQQPDKIWSLADQIAKITPDDLAAEVQTRNTAMITYSRTAPDRFDERLPLFLEKISQLPAADQSRYLQDMALAAARLQRYELTAELSAKVPLLIAPQFRRMDLSGRDRHPILFAATELLKQHQFDQTFALIDLVEDEAVELAALARVPDTIVNTNEAKQYPEVYSQSVERLAAAYRMFAEKHDEETLRSTVPSLPELLNVHLRRLASPPMPPDEVAYLNRDLLGRLGAHTDLMIEQGKINEVVELAEEILSQGDLGFTKWMARELAKAGNAGAFETLRVKINQVIGNRDAKKDGPPLLSWDYRQFLAQSAHNAYLSGQRDQCFAIFMQLDRNWMSPSFVSRVAAEASRTGDIAFLRRMKSSSSRLMREAALSALAMHHVLEGEIEAAELAAETFDKEFGEENEKWSIYRRITHPRNVTDPKRRIAATELALKKMPIDSQDYTSIASDHAKLLGTLFPTKPLPADWLDQLKSNPKLLLQVELDHAASRSAATAND